MFDKLVEDQEFYVRVQKLKLAITIISLVTLGVLNYFDMLYN
jgi:hypothetical protein